MRWKSHVRFGGRAGETHQPKGWPGALLSDPHTYVWTLAGIRLRVVLPGSAVRGHSGG